MAPYQIQDSNKAPFRIKRVRIKRESPVNYAGKERKRTESEGFRTIHLLPKIKYEKRANMNLRLNSSEFFFNSGKFCNLLG